MNDAPRADAPQSSPSQPDAPDVRQLLEQNLPTGPFPGSQGQNFRIFFAPETHAALWQHARSTTAVEVCGVLVGRWERDADGPFVAITAAIRGEDTDNRLAEVTFTHKTWAKINEEMDQKYGDLSIVGWYHTHPDFGIFLSDRDRFIHEHFFSGGGQVAHVIDPIRTTEGVFVWKSGKPSAEPFFWVGERLALSTVDDTRPRLTDAPDEPLGRTRTSSARETTTAGGEPAPYRFPLERMLAFVAVFLMGLLLSGWRSSWEQTRLAEGVVAHYGIWQGLKPGLDQYLELVAQSLSLLAKQTYARADDHVKRLDATKAPTKEADAIRDRWREVQIRLGDLAVLTDRAKSAYSLTPAEADALQRIIVDKVGGLQSTPAEPAQPPSKASPGKTGPPAAKEPAPASAATKPETKKTS